MDEPAPVSTRDAGGGPDRWRSAFESLLLPGLGQWRLGERGLAIVLLAAGILPAVLALCLLWNRAVPIPALATLVAAGLAAGLVSVLLAYRSAARRGAPGGGATPWRAAFWSRIFPGVGQMTQHRAGPGLAFLAAALLFAAFRSSVIGALLFAGVTLFAVRDALRRSDRRGDASAPVLMLLSLAILAGELSPLLLRTFAIEAQRVPSVSMRPTLEPGDYFFVDRTRAGRAERGDLLIYPIPGETNARFVKRCVALGGDTLEIRDQTLWINGRPVNEPFVVHEDAEIRPAGADVRDNLGPVAIPEGQVFVLGDNRENSNDSRFTGAIPMRTIRGRVLRIYWPPSRWNAIRDS